MHEESLRMQKAIHGEEANHPDIAASLYGLARCLEQQGHFEEAKAMHDKSQEPENAEGHPRGLGKPFGQEFLHADAGKNVIFSAQQVPEPTSQTSSNIESPIMSMNIVNH